MSAETVKYLQDARDDLYMAEEGALTPRRRALPGVREMRGRMAFPWEAVYPWANP
jgi:hypothetical protein